MYHGIIPIYKVRLSSNKERPDFILSWEMLLERFAKRPDRGARHFYPSLSPLLVNTSTVETPSPAIAIIRIITKIYAFPCELADSLFQRGFALVCPKPVETLSNSLTLWLTPRVGLQLFYLWGPRVNPFLTIFN